MHGPGRQRRGGFHYAATGEPVIQGEVDAIREHAQEWVGSFEDVERVREEFCDLGNGVTLTVWRQKGRPLDSIGWVQIRFAGVSIWADGLIERLTTYTDIDEARTAAERLAEERG